MKAKKEVYVTAEKMNLAEKMNKLKDKEVSNTKQKMQKIIEEND